MDLWNSVHTGLEGEMTKSTRQMKHGLEFLTGKRANGERGNVSQGGPMKGTRMVKGILIDQKKVQGLPTKMTTAAQVIVGC